MAMHNLQGIGMLREAPQEFMYVSRMGIGWYDVQYVLPELGIGTWDDSSGYISRN